jgi:hypothetical protein
LIASKALDKNQPEYEWINLNLKLPRQGKSPKKKKKKPKQYCLKENGAQIFKSLSKIKQQNLSFWGDSWSNSSSQKKDK